mmetsp:Transcript_60797/g.181143  ORF Transcript_60797/g.181143 Transcript_60797/m.181143 type:complete len:338 (-) Transcript_60797:38-1051(-)
MLRTVATEMLGIEHPIVCGGMTATGSAELAAAVSNAGCLGMLTCLHCKTPERLHEEIARCRRLTSRPFAVNLTLLGEKRGAPEFPEGFCDVICGNGIRIVETCGGSIPLMSKIHERLRSSGVKVIISKCVHVRSALTAQDKLGSDMVSLMGFDSGGLPGEADVGLFVTLALAKKSLRIPFLASGGCATGRQLVAALALGAAGVQVGTRFNATVECNIFPQSFKERMVKADDRSTVMVMKPFKGSSRVFKNATAAEINRIEQEKGKKLQFPDIGGLVKFDLLMEGIAEQDPDKGVWNCGQSVALIDDVPTCKDLVSRLVREAHEAMDELRPQFAASKL